MKPLPDTYIRNASALLQELKDSLTTSDKESLKVSWNKMTSSERSDYLYMNSQEIYEYLEATPGQRKKKKKWSLETEHGKRMVLYSYIFGIHGYALMNLQDDVLRCQGLSYRSALALLSYKALNFPGIEFVSFFE